MRWIMIEGFFMTYRFAEIIIVGVCESYMAANVFLYLYDLCCSCYDGYSLPSFQ